MRKVITFTLEKDKKPTEHPNQEIRDLWEKLPSVTRVLSDTISDSKKQGLEKWRNDIGEEQAEIILTNSQNRGKLLDEKIELLAQNGKCGIDYIDDYFSEAKPENLQLGFICILDEIEVTLDSGELKTILFGYKGFIDFELYFADENNVSTSTVCDTKTWKKHKPSLWVDIDYKLQVSSYAKALSKKQAAIIGSDGISFRTFLYYENEVNDYYSQFLERLLIYIRRYKGDYPKKMTNNGKG